MEYLPKLRGPQGRFRFGLRTLLYAVAGLSLCCAAGVWCGPCGLVTVSLIGLWTAFFVWSMRGRAFVALLLVSCVLGGAAIMLTVENAEQASRQLRCAQNLKLIGAALRQYHDVYGSLPPAYIRADNGARMHSWRVLILPYLDMSGLYRRYSFSEPWDGPNNREYAMLGLGAFHCPNDLDSAFSWTNYVAIVGADTAWPGSSALALSDITGDLSETVLVVEMDNSGIPWSEPRDIDASDLASIARMKQPLHRQSFHALMADGSIRVLTAKDVPLLGGFQRLRPVIVVSATAMVHKGNGASLTDSNKDGADVYTAPGGSQTSCRQPPMGPDGDQPGRWRGRGEKRRGPI